MDDRPSLLTGAAYCGLFALPLQAAFATFLMRADPTPCLAVLPLFVLMAVLYLVSRLLLGRGVTPPVLAAAALALTAAGLAAVLALSRTTGAGQIAFAVVLILAGAGIALYSAFNPVTIPKLLTQSDVLMLCTLWACLLEAAGALTAGDLLFFLGGLLLNLICLLFLRTFGGSHAVIYGSRLQGTLLSVGLLAVIGGLLVLFVRCLSGASRSALAALLDGALALLDGAWGLFDRFFQWLAGLFPPSETEGALPHDVSMGGGADSELTQVEVDAGLLAVLGIALAAVAAVVLIVVLVRMRRVRLRLSAPASGGGRRAAPTRQSGALARRLRELLFRLRFRLTFALRRGTPAGVLVWLERWGARHGAPRLPWETPRAYLLRLGALPQLAGEETLHRQLGALADCLDLQYFGGKPSRLPPGDAGAIRHSVGRLSRTGAAERP